jgi:hypothetical protein
VITPVGLGFGRGSTTIRNLPSGRTRGGQTHQPTHGECCRRKECLFWVRGLGEVYVAEHPRLACEVNIPQSGGRSKGDCRVEPLSPNSFSQQGAYRQDAQVLPVHPMKTTVMRRSRPRARPAEANSLNSARDLRRYRTITLWVRILRLRLPGAADDNQYAPRGVAVAGLCRADGRCRLRLDTAEVNTGNDLPWWLVAGFLIAALAVFVVVARFLVKRARGDVSAHRERAAAAFVVALIISGFADDGLKALAASVFHSRSVWLSIPVYVLSYVVLLTLVVLIVNRFGAGPTGATAKSTDRQHRLTARLHLYPAQCCGSWPVMSTVFPS